jgi:formylglycine-generating enzyme required for sulfatase activity
MRTKIGLALIGIIGLALGLGLALAQKAPKEKPVPPGMVLVPAGEFIMGMSADDALKECRKFYGDKCGSEGPLNEGPVHKVYLDAYSIDKREATQEDYDKCVAAGKCKANNKHDGFTGPRQPVVGVTWDDAKSYCSWAGKRLPTEAEWEKAARGPDGRMYPWGNEFDGKKANFCDKNCSSEFAAWDDGYAKTAPVGSYPSGASPYGALDMAGNVWEWTADWYQDDYYKNSPAKNPKGPDTGAYRVLRGGSWFDTTYDLRVAGRVYAYPPIQFFNIGFRCAGD